MGDKKRKLEQNPPEDVAAIEPEGKKAKRELKREGKKEKRRKEKDVVDVVDGEEVKTETKDKKEKKGKKEKKESKEKAVTGDSDEKPAEETNGVEPESNQNQEAPEAMDLDVAETDAKQESKKEKKKKSKKDKKQKGKSESETNPGPEAETAQPEEDSEKQSAPQKKAARFIVFVGNLPYSANAESLTKHFEKISPISVRVATQPDKPTKCRGFGFVEFDNYDRMKTCLKLYHHSSFDDGKYPPRRINVELTAGGGGKSQHRKAKIEEKNRKLAEERKRNAKDMQKEKGRRANAEETGVDDYANVHPSRRMRMD